MKVVIISNFALETYAERIATSEGPVTYALENLDEVVAKAECDLWNERNASENSYGWAVVKPDDYVLWRGMADLVGEPDEINDLGNNKAMQTQMDALAKDHDENEG